MKQPEIYDVFGVLELQPGGVEHTSLLRLLQKTESEQHSELVGNPAVNIKLFRRLPSSLPLTLLVLPDLRPVRFTEARWQVFEAEFRPRFTPKQPDLRQYCLKTGAAPSVRAFSKEGVLSGPERVHWFGHHSVDLINRAGTKLLDGRGQRVIERLCRYGRGSIAIVYFGGRPDHSFEDCARRWWRNFNQYLDGETDFLIKDPFCRVRKARQPIGAAL